MDEQFAALLHRFLRFAGDRELTEESPLFELGLDSMRAMELMFEIEDTFGVELPEHRLVDATFQTAGSLWLAVVEARDGRSERAS